MIDTSWSFSQAVNNIRTIKDQYIGLLSSFSIYELKQKNIAMGEIRKEIYSLKILEWQKDKLWEFMNNDIPFNVLYTLGNRQKNN